MYKPVFLICLIFACCPIFPAGAADCQMETPDLARMEVREAHLAGPDSRRLTLAVHIADEDRERAAGFQRICPEVADRTSILFLFERSRIPSFHMNNVHMPLDIAFIDDSGVIRDIQTMTPYILGMQGQRELWSPPTPVRAALEVKAGRFAELGVTPGEWSITVAY